MSLHRCLPPRVWLLAGSCLALLLLVFGLSGGDLFQPQLPSLHHDILDDISNASLGVRFSHCKGELKSPFTYTLHLKFQKIFVIGLPARTDHRDSMSLAAALTGLSIEYVDGVTSVDNKTLPPGGIEKGLNKGSVFGWRAHMNVLRMIVEQNITSALVLEDDIDWDLRIKSQMREFARASRLLVQPIHGTTDTYLDPTHPEPRPGQDYQDFDIDSNSVTEPTSSPYGDISRWDLLWLGHCGTRFPRPSDINAPLGRVVITNDETVPEHKHLNMEYGNDDLIRQYDPHTRVVSRARLNTCSLGYGISQGGARRFLWELGTKRMSDTNDMMFRHVCDGVEGRELGICLTVQPQLFQHHRPVGPRAGFSDISDHGNGYNDRAFTRNFRWSVRLNFQQLITGKTDYTDLFADGAEKLNLPPG